MKGDIRMSITAELAKFVSRLAFQDLPKDVVEISKICIMDVIGCSIFGIHTEEGQKVISAVEQFEQGSESTIWGHSSKASSPFAAFVNGTTAHSRELDDVNYAILHPGSVIIPASLAVAEKMNSDGQTFITAVVAGYEMMTRIAVGLNYFSHRYHGWHGTATCGSFGAAASAGKILGLDAAKMAWAMGIAGSTTADYGHSSPMEV